MDFWSYFITGVLVVSVLALIMGNVYQEYNKRREGNETLTAKQIKVASDTTKHKTQIDAGLITIQGSWYDGAEEKEVLLMQFYGPDARTLCGLYCVGNILESGTFQPTRVYARIMAE